MPFSADSCNKYDLFRLSFRLSDPSDHTKVFLVPYRAEHVSYSKTCMNDDLNSLKAFISICKLIKETVYFRFTKNLWEQPEKFLSTIVLPICLLPRLHTVLYSFNQQSCHLPRIQTNQLHNIFSWTASTFTVRMGNVLHFGYIDRIFRNLFDCNSWGKYLEVVFHFTENFPGTS